MPIRTIETRLLRIVLLSKVDKTGVGEYGHSYQHQQQAQFLIRLIDTESDTGTIIYLVCLLESVEQGLETCKVPHQLEDPQYPHHSDQSDHLASLANNFKIFQTFQ